MCKQIEDNRNNLANFAPERITNSYNINRFSYEKDCFNGNDGDGIYDDARPE